MNPVTCCGHDRATRFCPDCGRKLAQPTHLDALLTHCRSVARKFSVASANAARDAEQCASTGRGNAAEDRRSQSVQLAATAATWTQRADALAELMDRTG